MDNQKKQKLEQEIIKEFDEFFKKESKRMVADYNKDYYAKNKKKILEGMYRMVVCEHCKKKSNIVIYQDILEPKNV